MISTERREYNQAPRTNNPGSLSSGEILLDYTGQQGESFPYHDLILKVERLIDALVKQKPVVVSANQEGYSARLIGTASKLS